MVKFGSNRGGNRGVLVRGGNRQQGGFKRGGRPNFRRRDDGDNDQPRRQRFGDGGNRRGGPRRGGRRGGNKGPRDHTALDEDMLQYWDKAGNKVKREEDKVLKQAKLDRELEEYKLNAGSGAANDQKA